MSVIAQDINGRPTGVAGKLPEAVPLRRQPTPPSLQMLVTWMLNKMRCSTDVLDSDESELLPVIVHSNYEKSLFTDLSALCWCW